MKNITVRQQEILDHIKNFISQKGYSPSLREIAEHFHIASPFGVKRHIDALVKKGFLKNVSNTNRTLSVVNKNSEPEINPQIITIPVIGRVAAGSPILAVENIEDNLHLDKSVLKNYSDCFALKVRGDSMINAGIFEGDLVIVSPKRNAVNGEIVIALIGDDTTVKRFEKTGDNILLVAENAAYPPIIINNREDFSIIGKVIGVMRWYN